MVDSGAERLTILHSLYLQIPAGQFVAIVGPSGSGKSTLLTLMAGLDKPTTGHIRLAGEWLPYLTENELARLRRDKLGFVFQAFHLVPSLTAFENVLVPMEMAGPRLRSPTVQSHFHCSERQRARALRSAAKRNAASDTS